MTNLLRTDKKSLVEDTYLIHHHFFPAEKFRLEKQLVHLRLLTHLFSPFFFFFSLSLSLSLKNNHNSLISISRLLFFSLSSSSSPVLSLSLSPIYLFNQSSLLLLLSANDQVAHRKTKIL
jgi:hypothetical protein